MAKNLTTTLSFFFILEYISSVHFICSFYLFISFVYDGLKALYTKHLVYDSTYQSGECEILTLCLKLIRYYCAFGTCASTRIKAHRSFIYRGTCIFNCFSKQFFSYRCIRQKPRLYSSCLLEVLPFA